MELAVREAGFEVRERGGAVEQIANVIGSQDESLAPKMRGEEGAVLARA